MIMETRVTKAADDTARSSSERSERVSKHSRLQQNPNCFYTRHAV